MVQKVYCVIDAQGCALDVADTMRGAQIKARRDGYQMIAVRFPMSGAVYILARLVAGKRGGRARWQLTEYGVDRNYAAPDETIAQTVRRCGVVQADGCTLTKRGDRYHMEDDNNPAQCYSLAISATTDRRLAIHWAGFCANRKHEAEIARRGAI